MPEVWAGVDIGKEHHHCVVIDAQGERLLSRRVLNDETAMLELIGDVLAFSEAALWAVDINHGGAALLIGLLLSHDQPKVYLAGLAVHQASAAYRGQGKTDAKDAFVIADQASTRAPRRAPARRRDSRRPQDSGQTPHRPGQRPHPSDQPAPRTTPGDLPGLGASAEPDEQGPGSAADRLPDAGSHPPQRCQARSRPGRRTARSEGLPCSPSRRRGGPVPARRAARREAGRLDGGPPREGGDGPRRGLGSRFQRRRASNFTERVSPRGGGTLTK